MKRPSLKLVGIVGLAVLVIIVGSLALFRDFNFRELIMKNAVLELENYLAPKGTEGTEFVKLTDRVYTYRWSWYRNIVIDTDDGLVIVDPFNQIAAKQLYDTLQKQFPGRRVHTLIYSHYHLDHATGGRVFNAEHVIAHEKCPRYWNDVNAKDIAQPTMLISGDQKLNIGNVRIELLHMGKSHTDTLYVVYLPQEDLLFTPDFGLIKTIPPLGWPDCYIPGALTEFEKLSKLKFSIFVPSHFGYGTREDFKEAMEFMKYFRRLCREAVEKYGIDHGSAFPTDAENLGKMFEYVYYPLKERYSSWHGFNEMALIAAIRHLTGESIGY